MNNFKVCVQPSNEISPIFRIVADTSNVAKCFTALKRFRGVSDVSPDLAEMQNEVLLQKLDPEWSFMKLLRTRSLRRPLIIVCLLAMSQQLAGINVVSIHGAAITGIASDRVCYVDICLCFGEKNRDYIRNTLNSNKQTYTNVNTLSHVHTQLICINKRIRKVSSVFRFLLFIVSFAQNYYKLLCWKAYQMIIIIILLTNLFASK